MEKRKMITKAVAVALACSMAFSVSPTVGADAAKKKPKLNKTSVSLEKGKKVTLKVNKNGKKISKITWKSSKKSVATVSSKGSVKAKAEGNTTISASFKVKGAKKKTTLKCKVKVYEWKTCENVTLTDSVKEAVKGVTTEYVGATYEPIAVLSEQLEVGHNYRVLCKTTEVTQNPVSYYSIIEVALTKKDDPVGFTVYAKTKGIVDALSTDLAGGMNQVSDPEIPVVAKPLILNYIETNKIPYNPVAILGQQVLSGANKYLVVCERKEPSKMGYALANISVDATLTPTIGDIFPFSFEKDYSVSTDLSAAVVETAAATVRNAVAKNDWDTIADMIDYPIEIGSTSVKDAAEFKALIESSTVAPEFITAVTDDSCVDLYANYQGVMVGADGEIWMNERDGVMKITMFNGLIKS